MNPNQIQSSPRLGNIPLTPDQFQQLSTLKTYADMGIPDSYLMPYFEQVMGQSFLSPTDKYQQQMEDEASKLQLYQLRKELGLDTKGLEDALGIGSVPDKLDISQYKTIEDLKKAVANYELQGEDVDPIYKKIAEFAEYSPDFMTAIMATKGSRSSQPSLNSFGERVKTALASSIPIYTPFFLSEKYNQGREQLLKDKYGSDYDRLLQYQSNFE